MTKDEIINTQDGQALADAVAVEVRGFATIQPTEEWQPHLSTEKGKAQCWDLAEKCGLEIEFTDKRVFYKDYTSPHQHSGLPYTWQEVVGDENMQTAVLKAALLSVRSE